VTLPEFVAGDTYPFVVDLTVGGKPFPIDPATGLVDACWVQMDGSTAITAVAAQASGAPGAAWATGRVAIAFPAEESEKLGEHRQAILEIQANTLAGKQSWRSVYDIVPGVIP
jgi:hypothetical protein